MEPRTFICVASGPSLTAADCRRAEKSGFPIIAVNNSWQRVKPNYLFAADAAWWKEWSQQLPENISRWTVSRIAANRYGINHLNSWLTRETFNSGQLAIELAYFLGARRILLLGYDCSVRYGTHWHGEHPHLRNPDSRNTAIWRREFARVEKVMAGAEIINCSRYTEIDSFPVRALEEFI